ncbi:23S rRNA (guanosine-2'-O-)-methyltransferase RlmB [Legionella massiliensis]|uniref:23S rRNA (guanosine-2'-O-)-methyltransferase RlmB n=1 Tax=Legionella massiliensis TaxID=1034943 RepID=A0A078KWD5_9GAMM|nr:23S rRNA (guanosine(2251)-2'-O)-methyltransferase RlmB [Legionella massiliensis]CDZ76064.1 23S rRNA (guanosine-2'-O-)-methyltransferase RlmB [Legionella massiliensis]CEE11802.1 23S rRNA (guanosine-2'-O-)-methyltransferase RlmB [Legionella massiliensis]
MSEQYVYGVHAVKALLANRHRPTKKLYINQERLDKRLEELLQLAETYSIVIERLSSQKMNQRFSEFKHQGVVASAGVLPSYGESDLPALLAASKQPCLILILDGVTDPHNLGACLRSADATGVDFVLIPKDKNADITPVVSKVACGAAESIPLVRVTNLVRAMEIIKQEGVWIYGAAGEANETLYNLDCKSSIALVMGAEGEGMRRLTREHCDGLFALPMLGSVESLNVSVATGVCLYEVVRQRSL